MLKYVLFFKAQPEMCGSLYEVEQTICRTSARPSHKGSTQLPTFLIAAVKLNGRGIQAKNNKAQ